MSIFGKCIPPPSYSPPAYTPPIQFSKPAPIDYDLSCRKAYGQYAKWDGKQGVFTCVCVDGYQPNAAKTQCEAVVKPAAVAPKAAAPVVQPQTKAVVQPAPVPAKISVTLQKMPANPKGMVVSDSLGKTWWIDPSDGKKYPLHGVGDMGWLVQKKALGISNKDIATLTGNAKASKAMITRLRGKVLMAVESDWRRLWVEPVSGKVVDLGTDLTANLDGMRRHAVGLAGGDLAKFTLGSY